MNTTRGIAGVLLTLLTAGCGKNGTGTEPAPVAPSGRIVFQSTRPGGNPELLVMDPDGHNVQTLLGGPASYQSPRFSPSGSRIAFSSNRDGNFAIYVMNRDGTGLARVTGTSVSGTVDDDSPSWSPDGQKLVFARSLQLGAALMVVNVDGTGETALTPVVTSGYLDWASWSPDGARIAYTAGGTSGIYVMNADGSGATRVSPLADTTDHPSWSPDGTEIAAHSLSHGLIVMHPDGSNRDAPGWIESHFARTDRN